MVRTKKQTTFEEAFARLEEITRELEAGEIPLDHSLALFEEGIGLVRWSSRKLEEARQKVEILLKNEDGDVRTEEFTAS